MDFVGRKREIAAVTKSLKQSRNVVVIGRYGVGRSRLIKHVSKLYTDRWKFLFADFSKTAAQSCNDMVNQLVQRRRKSLRERYTRLIYAKDLLIGEKAAADPPRVVVLDNIGKISHRKLAFIRDLRFDSELLFIAIAESFLSEGNLFRLRSVLYPLDVIPLHNLNHEETAAFFRDFSKRKSLGWSESFIQMLAASTEGYPLLMKERVQREVGPDSNAKNVPTTSRN
jgi:AAA ATPase domain